MRWEGGESQCLMLIVQTAREDTSPTQVTQQPVIVLMLVVKSLSCGTF